MTDLPGWDGAGAPKKPLIVGIGAQKAGTTWLSQMLAQHPQVWLPPFKEVQFFNHRFIPEHREWLPWHFRRARQNQEKRFAAKGLPVPPELGRLFARDGSGRCKCYGGGGGHGRCSAGGGGRGSSSGR